MPIPQGLSVSPSTPATAALSASITQLESTSSETNSHQQQGANIEDLRAELAKVRNELAVLRAEHAMLKEQVRAMKGKNAEGGDHAGQQIGQGGQSGQAGAVKKEKYGPPKNIKQEERD